MTAVGLCGADAGLFTGESLSGVTRTGRIRSVQRKILDLLLGASIVPVVSSTSMDSAGEALNINADEVALAIAAEMKALGLLFLSDIRRHHERGDYHQGAIRG
jgi:acetylglutamate kinase